MRALGAWLAGLLGPGDLVVLAGPLGAGKTVLVSGLAAGLGSAQPVTSPTFVLVHEHRDGRAPLLHVDAYRLARPAEVADLDLDLEAAVTVVEWGEGLVEDLGAGLPSGHLLVRIERPVGVGGDWDAAGDGDASAGPGAEAPAEARTVRLEPATPAWAARLRRLVALTPAAVLFDLDGVLADSKAAVERHWAHFAERHGLDRDRVLAGAHGRRSVDHVTDLLAGASAEFIARENVRFERLEVEENEGVTALPGAAALWATLDAGSPGAPVGVVTSGTAALARARLGIAGLAVPQVLVTAEDVVAGKPDPQGYLRAAHLLGVPPGECLVVEDAAAGVRAGRAAGARVLGLLTTHTADELAAADHLAEDLSAVLAVDGRLWVITTG
jgi:sugar-phosphatase